MRPWEKAQRVPLNIRKIGADEIDVLNFFFENNALPKIQKYWVIHNQGWSFIFQFWLFSSYWRFIGNYLDLEKTEKSIIDRNWAREKDFCSTRVAILLQNF